MNVKPGNRKMLQLLALTEPYSFKALADVAKEGAELRTSETVEAVGRMQVAVVADRAPRRGPGGLFNPL